MKKSVFSRVLALILALVTAVSICAVAGFSVSAADFTVYTTDAVRLRSSAEITDDNIITTLGVGEKLTLLAESKNNWANVMRSNGTKGYCSVDYLDTDDSTVEFTGVTTEEANLRKGASADFDSLKLLSADTDFVVLDNSDEYWVKVKAGNLSGYVYKPYTKLTLKPVEKEAPTEPEVTVPETTVPEVTVPDVTVPVVPHNTADWYSASVMGDDFTSSKAPLRGGFYLSHSEISIKTGESFNIDVISLGGSLDNSVKFTSSAPKVAKAQKGGVILGLTEGETLVTAAFGEFEQTVLVKVTGKAYTPEEPTNPADPEVPTTPVEPTVPSTKPQENPVFNLSASSANVEMGNLYVLGAPYENAVWKSSNTAVATVEDGIVTALSVGKCTITATADGKKGTCEITVTKASSGISIEYDDIDIEKGKTFYNAAYSSADIRWTSSDEKIAEVDNGFITAKNTGVAVISATSSKGTRTCFVNVIKAEPVKFSYAYPNTAYKGEEITLVAVTDKTRKDVDFKINVNGQTVTVDNATKKSDGDTYVWTATTKINESGTFNVTAYSSVGSSYSTSSGGKTTVFVRDNKDLSKETKEYRRASDELISLIASFEGYIGSVYYDNLAGGLPTLGYGKVMYVGDSFYNNMTRTEALAQLYDTVNNGGYSHNVNTYLQSLDANYNQRQFDSLVSFAYNIGYYGLKSDTEIRSLILSAKEKKPANSQDKTKAYINGTDVNFRSGAGTNYDSLGLLNAPEELTLLEEKLVNQSWYHVKDSQGREGYVYKDYVTLGAVDTEGEIYLSLINKQEFTRVVLEYHHASSYCIMGLLWRRVDELDLFYNGDYIRDGDDNKYGYSFVCYLDSSVRL